jgi:hypothetical protein
LRLQPDNLLCDRHTGCTTDHCCLKSTCDSYFCPPPMTSRLQADSLSCGVDGCSIARCCLEGTPPPIPQPVYRCRVGDAVVATWQGDGRQYRAEIQSVNGNEITVNWQDGDTTYPVIHAAQVFKNDKSCAGNSAGHQPQGPPASGGGGIGGGGGVQVTSDGSVRSPHCSWHAQCVWDYPTKETCARHLCTAAGYAGGSYVSSSNNMCTESYTSAPFHYFSVDTHQYTSSRAGEGNEAQITASCVTQGGSQGGMQDAGAPGGGGYGQQQQVQSGYSNRVLPMANGPMPMA